MTCTITPATQTLSYADLLDALDAPIPANQQTPLRRVTWLFSGIRDASLKAHDQATYQAAKSFYDGSLSRIARQYKKITAEQVVDLVLAKRAGMFPASSAQFEAEDAALAAIVLPWYRRQQADDALGAGWTDDSDEQAVQALQPYLPAIYDALAEWFEATWPDATSRLESLEYARWLESQRLSTVEPDLCWHCEMRPVTLVTRGGDFCSYACQRAAEESGRTVLLGLLKGERTLVIADSDDAAEWDGFLPPAA